MKFTHFLSVLQIFILTRQQLCNAIKKQVGDECNGGKGDCKYIINCPAIADNFDRLKPHQIEYCDRESSLLCCPKTTIQTRVEYYGDESHIFIRECQKYRKISAKCQPTPLIVSGVKAEPKEFPHMALLGVKQVNNDIKWLCGGTLISTTYVLTAAHCFSDREIPNMVRLGELDYSTTTDDALVQDFVIKNYITHPRYDVTEKYNDVALVRLDGEAQLNAYVVPACLPLSNGTEFRQFIAAGWGATKVASTSSSHLLKVTLERYDDAECKSLVEENDDLEEGIRVHTQVCAGSRTDSRDTCSGDSGGPLFIDHPDYKCMYMLIGVTSFGFSCGIAGTPGVYARVNLFVDWIERIVWDAATGI